MTTLTILFAIGTVWCICTVISLRRKSKDMKEITKEQYEVANDCMEEILKSLTDEVHEGDPIMQELDRVTNIVEQYENEHVHIPLPTLGELIICSMQDWGITEENLAQQLGISQSKLADFIKDKEEPSLRIACQLCRILHINPVSLFEVVTARLKENHK